MNLPENGCHLAAEDPGYPPVTVVRGALLMGRHGLYFEARPGEQFVAISASDTPQIVFHYEQAISLLKQLPTVLL